MVEKSAIYQWRRYAGITCMPQGSCHDIMDERTAINAAEL